ncbi:NTP transferase domain-containing protein [Nordella sp. HKS 07]|uniref:sugar phosphate nucleotidyltransferase n=1 Tax=Nordella sp. HKS 07 TaxID=2712222 RepID=UPI0013E1D263|nr:sugar phosphate nucleotidyltransferase [Nordella sp. HKS 07]QIG46464.1 NTP transferase domain-containing protein [Nordella sp. HKS 07]
MTAPIIPLIVCGGSGSRLQPLSRDGRPKQFLRLIGEHSTFEETLRRVADASLFGPPMIVTHGDYEADARVQLSASGMTGEILLEPERRNSGPAILAGALLVVEAFGENALVLALAADHWVRDIEGFRESCRRGLAAAEAGAIVTFGIVPDHPATAYGYIEPGERAHGDAHEVRRFVEKPDAESAASYMQEGLLWNSGNFLFRVATLLAEYRAFDAATADTITQAVKNARRAANALHLEDTAFGRAASRSIDHAVMEKTTHAMVVRASFDWADIGSWRTLHRLLESQRRAQGRLRSFTIEARGAITIATRRPEHWIVAEGIAAFDGAELRANEFVRLQPGETRRIENMGENELRLIAVTDET